MPIFDFECSCGNIQERVERSNINKVVCPVCGGQAKKIISVSKVNTANEDSGWLKTVLEVVDKDSKEPHVAEFRQNPTRSNYRKWMKGENIRPLQNPVSGHGEAYESKQKRLRASKTRIGDITDSIMRQRQARK